MHADSADDDGTEAALLDAVAARRDELVALTQALVRIPTVNPPGARYADCAALIGARLAARGFAVDYLRAAGAPGDSDAYPRVNVVARIEAPRPGACVHFNGHIDVVEPGSGWSVDPFAAVLQGGRIVGRGSCDMKGGLAAAIIACEALIASGAFTHGALEVSGTVDEESGGYAGVDFLARSGRIGAPRVDHVIIPEPLNVDRICLGHRGVWWAEVETRGRIAHGSMPFLGSSAIEHMGALLHRIDTQLKPRLAERRSALPVVPEAARAPTINVNAVHGGQPEQRYALNALGQPCGELPAPLVADSCRAVLDRRFIAEERLDEVKAEIVAMLEELKATRAGFDYQLRDIMQFLPSATPADAPIVHATARAIARVLGRAPSFVASPGTYDHKHVLRSGGLASCIAYGPGILDLAHQPDEYVAVDDLVQASQVLALAARSLLRRPGRNP